MDGNDRMFPDPFLFNVYQPMHNFYILLKIQSKNKWLIYLYCHSPLLFLLWEYLNASYLWRDVVIQCLFGAARRGCQLSPVLHAVNSNFHLEIWFGCKVSCRIRHCCCSWWRVSIYPLFKTWNKTTFRIFCIWQNLTFQYCLHIFQFSNLKWLCHQTSLSTWKIHEISFCLNNRYQMS